MNVAVSPANVAHRFDVVIVGAGPAGIVAACLLAEHGKRVAVIEQMRFAGGQIWRNAEYRQAPTNALPWLQRFRHSGIQFFNNTRVIGCDRNGTLHAVRENEQPLQFNAKTLIIATGAREHFLPFPGWTLPQVTGAGALQVMVKDGLNVRGKNIVVAGTGPLLWAVADTLHTAGANVRAIVEQRTRWQLVRFACTLWRWPRTLMQALALQWRLRHVPLKTNSWISNATGEADVTRCTIQHGKSSTKTMAVDWLACGYGLQPHHMLSRLFAQQNRNPSIDCFSIGDCTQVAGVQEAITQAKHCVQQILKSAKPPANKPARYAELLQKHFPLRAELKTLATDDTLLCRCEGVTFGEVKHCRNLREAKLYHRLSMGRCQGAICASAAQTVFGWQPLATKMPLTPAPMQVFSAPQFDSTCSTPSDHQGVMP